MKSAPRFLLFPLFLLITGRTAPAQQPADIGTVVVSAAKHETSLRSVSTTATVITRNDMLEHGYRTADEALRSVVSFDIAQQGGPGGLSFPQMRGLPGKYLVVMIDGVRVNDPTDPNGGVGTLFSHLTTDDIERIEVIRGPQSPLYGSNAATGVINIITAAGSGNGEFKVSYEGGSLASHRLNFGYRIEEGPWSLRADQNITDTDGVIDLESYRNLTTSVKLGYRKPGTVEWESLVRYAKSSQNYAELIENYGGKLYAFQLPDPNQKNDFDYLTVGSRVRHRINSFWQHELNFGVSDRNRRTVDRNDGQLGSVPAPYDNFTLDFMSYYNLGQTVPVFDTPWGESDYTFEGRQYDFDYRHILSAATETASDIFTTGFEYIYQDYRQSGTEGPLARNIGMVGFYLHNQTLLLQDALSLNSGFRYDDHQQTGGHSTGMFGASYDMKEIGLVLRGNLGSAFRSPSIYELFLDAPYGTGNPDLSPETSFTWEFGIEKYASDCRIRLMAAAWHTRVDNAIIWQTDPLTYTGTYFNADKAESRGLEAGLGLKPHPNWKFGVNYTYTDSRKKSGGLWSRNVQLPYNKVNLNAAFLYRSCSLSLDGYWVDGSRLRWNGLDRADSYFKLDLTGLFPVCENFTLTFRARNLLDEDYVEEIGYREPGRTVFGGIELRY
ncbi:MAG: TonB-dependent receptor [Candidatus Glassbacteria bacterium]